MIGHKMTEWVYVNGKQETKISLSRVLSRHGGRGFKR
jgi:hypothetical protein